MKVMLFCVVWVFVVALAEPFAWDVPPTPPPVDGECSEAVDIVPGTPIPASIVDADGNARCAATIVPTSDLAGLLLADAWASRAAPRGRRLIAENEWERERYARLSAAFDKPTPWFQRPATQRTLGRVEMFAVIALTVGAYAVLDAEVSR